LKNISLTGYLFKISVLIFFDIYSIYNNSIYTINNKKHWTKLWNFDGRQRENISKRISLLYDARI